MRLKTLLRILPHSRALITGIVGMRNQDVFSTREHLKLCGDWLLQAQEITGSGGYMAYYSLIIGIQHAYIETTGYIVPTMFDLASHLKDERYRDSALRAGEWLLSVQQSDGSFTDIDSYKPQVFDTGQVMLGLNRLYRETKDSRYLDATRRAAEWLLSVQDADGSWTSASYHRGHPCVYLSRSAAALIESAQLTGETRHLDGAARFLRWAASRQQPNGFFLNCELKPNADPVSHTLVYVLEGFLMAYQLTGEREWLDVLMRGAEPLKKAQLERDLVVRSQYSQQWEVTNSEKCVPGLAQWAALSLALRDITSDPTWFEAAQLAIYYLKSKQLRGKGILHGALPASVPLWGYYHPLMFPNWAVKFFADALLAYDKYELPVWKEQELWASRCFTLHLDGGRWEQQSHELEPLDLAVLPKLEEFLGSNKTKSPRVLEIGCGEGRYLDYLSNRHREWQLAGIDPGHQGDSGLLKKGSAYEIPFPDGSFDGAFSHIVFQHVADVSRALSEVRRVLKPGGLLAISDRNAISARGVLKPWHELRGRWLYPWDSPFRERWFGARKWKELLKANGFEILRVCSINNPSDKGFRSVIPTNRFLLVMARKK